MSCRSLTKCLLLPCFYIGYPFVFDKFITLTGNSLRLLRWRAFKKARNQLQEAIANNDDQKLYSIFMQLFQELGKSPDEFFSVRPQYKMDENSPEGDLFFERITHAAYGKSDNKNSDQLCRMAKQWLERLEKTI